MTDPSVEMLKFFAYEHLPSHLQGVSLPFCELAQEVVRNLPSGPEKTMCMRKLLEAKDCAVRAALVDGPGDSRG